MMYGDDGWDDNVDEKVRTIKDYQRSELAESGMYGLCSRCKRLAIQITELGTEVVWCGKDPDESRVFLHPRRMDPIKKCTYFLRVGEVGRMELQRLAWSIEVEDVNEMGFNGKLEKKRVVSIKPPRGG